MVGNPRELSDEHWQHFNTGTARKMPKTSPCPMMTVVDPIISIDTLQCNALLLSSDFGFWCLCCQWIHWKQQCVNRWNQDRSQMAATIGKLWLCWFMKQWSQMFWFLCITSLTLGRAYIAMQYIGTILQASLWRQILEKVKWVGKRICRIYKLDFTLESNETMKSCMRNTMHNYSNQKFISKWYI